MKRRWGSLKILQKLSFRKKGAGKMKILTSYLLANRFKQLDNNTEDQIVHYQLRYHKKFYTEHK